jgi:hypothetical protein
LKVYWDGDELLGESLTMSLEQLGIDRAEVLTLHT